MCASNQEINQPIVTARCSECTQLSIAQTSPPQYFRYNCHRHHHHHKEEDLAYATAVCEQAGVPLEVVPLQKEYWDQVVSYTVREAREGRTPNPDVMCNSRIKFGMFYDHVGKHFRHVATGHYARLERFDDDTTTTTARNDVDDNAAGAAGVATVEVNGNSGGDGGDGLGRVRLLLSPDAVKDQTYFLCALTQDQLRKALFPLGGYTKETIRELAESYDLPTKNRKDSQASEQTEEEANPACTVDFTKGIGREFIFSFRQFFVCFAAAWFFGSGGERQISRQY